MYKVFSSIGIIAFVFIIIVLTSPAKALTQVNDLADTPWPMYQHDPQHTGRSPFLGPLQKPELLWTVQLVQCIGESGGISIASDGSLLLSIGGCLSNFDPTTRQIRWRYQLTGNSMSVPLISADQNIYWGFSLAFAKIGLNGEQKWVAELDPNWVFNSSPTFGMDGNLYFVHDGVWSFTTDGVFRWFLPYGEVGAHASPAIGLDGNIYAGTDIGYEDICAYTINGDVVWCKDIPGGAYDRTVSVASDGTIYIPTAGNTEPYSDSGVLDAIYPSGAYKWKFQPSEHNNSGIFNGIAIAPDGSIYFAIMNYSKPESYIYSVSPAGQFQWKVTLSKNPLTGVVPFINSPITIDRTGNAFICAENSHCYGISVDGTILWDFEFPLTESISVAAVTQPILSQDGFIYLVDNYQRLYAYADPTQYPLLRTSTDYLDFSVDKDSPIFTATVPITSTVAPITFTVTVNPEVSWISIPDPSSVTPVYFTINLDPSGLPAGNYQSTLIIEPSDSLCPPITIPVRLKVGIHPSYFPLTLSLGQTDRIVFTSNWFVENQLASINSRGSDRQVITHNLPIQIDDIQYSPDGLRAALVPYVSGNHEINIIDTGSGQTILRIADANVNLPSWSPDSSRLTYVSYKDDPYDGEVYIVNLDGTGRKRLTYNSLNETGMSWSPDGSKIAVQIRFCMIYIMNPDGTDFHQIITGHYCDVIYGWSPDGEYLLLGTTMSSQFDPLQVSTYNVQTGVYTPLADNLLSSAKWSPDGEKIVYVGYEGDYPYDWDIYIINPDGNDLVNLTYVLGKEDSQPTWSSNSKWIVFSSRSDESYNDPNYDIYIVNIDGTTIRQLTKNIQADYYPFWVR